MVNRDRGWAAAGMFLAGLLLATATAAAETRSVKLTLALFSDIYELDAKGARGGFARIAGALAAERAARKNVLVLHAGDTFSPSLLSSVDKGRGIVEITNMIAPDIFVPGNHEFDFGEQVFRDRIAEATFPLIAANLREADGKLVPKFSDTKIIEVEGVKVGVIGITDPDSAIRSSPGTFKFAPAVATAKSTAAELRKSGADLVVVVAHTTVQDDIRLVSSGDFDIVLSGHDHDLILNYDGRSVLAEAKSDGEMLVAIDLDIEVKTEPARQVTWHPRFRIVDTADVTPDAAVATRIAEIKGGLAKDLDVEIGSTVTALDSRKAAVRGSETAIGNFIADAMRVAVHAEVAVMNGGGIRADRTYEAGMRLTRRDIYAELPFGNKLVLVEMTGANLKAALENAVFYAGRPEGRFAQVSGLRMKVRKDAVPGSKITSIEVGGQPLDPGRTYKVATNDFLGNGKDGFTAFLNGKVLLSGNEGPLLVTVVIDAVRAKGTIAPVVEGRIVIE